RAWGPPTSFSLQRFRKGKRKAAVLPVPVWAWPMTSRPERTSGIRAAWIGVGSKYWALCSAARIKGERDKLWKPPSGSAIVAVLKQTSKPIDPKSQSVTYRFSSLLYFKAQRPFCLGLIAARCIPVAASVLACGPAASPARKRGRLRLRPEQALQRLDVPGHGGLGILVRLVL